MWHTPPNLLWPFGWHFDCPRGRGQGYPWKFFLGLCGPVLQIQILYVCQPFFLYDNYNCFIASLIMLFFSYHSSYRELKQLRWWPHWRLQKNNRFNDQNNSSACASRFLVHFLWRPLHDYDVKPPYLMFYGGRGHTMTNCPTSFWTWIKSLRIQLLESSPTFDILSGSK